MTSRRTSSASGAFIVDRLAAALVLSGAYDETYFAAGTEEYRRVFTASLGARPASWASAATSPGSRSRAASTCCSSRVGHPAAAAQPYAGRRVIQRLRSRGAARPPDPHRRRAAARRGARRRAPARVLARLLDHRLRHRRRARPSPRPAPASRSWAAPPTSPSIVASRQVDTLLIAEGAFEHGTTLRQMAWELEKHAHLEIAVAPEPHRRRRRPRRDPSGGGPAARLRRPHPRPGRRPLGQAGLRHRRLARAAGALVAAVAVGGAAHQARTTAARCSSGRPASAATARPSSA